MAEKSNNFITRFKGDDRSLQAAFSRTQAGFRSVGRGAIGAAKGVAAIGAAGLAAAAGIVYMGNRASETLDASGKRAEQLSLEVKQLHAISDAAELAGSSQEAITKAFDRFQRSLGDAARGKKGAIDALDTIHESTLGYALALNQVNSTEAFQHVLSQLSTLDEATRSSVGAELFGRNWREAFNVVRENETALTDRMKQNERIGLEVSERWKNSNAQMRDSFTEVEIRVERFGQILTAAFSPHIGGFVKGLTQGLDNLAQEMGGYDKIAEDLANSFTRLASESIPALIDRLEALLGNLQTIYELNEKVSGIFPDVPGAAGNLLTGDVQGAAGALVPEAVSELSQEAVDILRQFYDYVRQSDGAVLR